MFLVELQTLQRGDEFLSHEGHYILVSTGRPCLAVQLYGHGKGSQQLFQPEEKVLRVLDEIGRPSDEDTVRIDRKTLAPREE